jgi:hypothetical protein
VTKLWAECSKNCGSKGKMHKRRKLKRKMKMKKRECQSGRQTTQQK